MRPPLLSLVLPALLIAFAVVPAAGAPAPPDSAAAGEPYYFYHGLDYGSESLINPLQLTINGGFGIMQVSNRDNRIFDIDYGQGWKNVWKNVLDPTGCIQADGWWHFLKREIIPVSIDRGQAQYWPNYTQHLIGGGMSYRTQVEWYRRHGVAHSRTWAAVTLMSYHLLNEVVENDDYDGWTTDPVADLWIFDPLSIWLFSHDSVCRFFSETLHMRDWSYQPVYDPERRTLENNGQNFSMKWDIPGWDRWSVFYHFGTHGEVGLSHTWDGGDCLSAGGGFKADTLVDITDRTKTVELAVSGGVFWDRNGSLLASLLVAKSKDYAQRLNVYPGVFKIAGLSPGLFAAWNRDGKGLFGISLASLGLPVGVSTGGSELD